MQRHLQFVPGEIKVLLLVGLLRSMTAYAQTQGPAPFGNGEQPTLRYAGETGLKNFFLVNVGAESGYDDNVLNNNAYGRRGEGFVGFSPRIAFGEERRAYNFIVDYSPSLEVYQRTKGYNRLNHSLGLDFGFRPGSHVLLRLRDNTSYLNGIFQPNSGQSFITGLGSPTNLNPYIYVPLARQFINESRLDLTYQKSYRTSFTLSGGYMLSEYTNVSAGAPLGLLGTRGWFSGLQYSFRLSKRTTFGIQYLLNNYTFKGYSRGIVNGVFFSVAHQFSPTLALQVFAGPQYARQSFQAGSAFPLPPGIGAGTSTFSDSWNTAAGGTLTKQAGKTALAISVERVTSNGSGLASLLNSNTATFDVRRRLPRRWEVGLDLMASYQTQIAGPSVSEGIIRSQLGSASLSRTLAKGLLMRLSYSYLHQRAQGGVVYLADADRNRASLGIFYDLGRFPLGR
jgi:hypothetical protein